MRVLPTVCGFCSQFAESAYTLRIPLTVCGFFLLFRLPRQLKFTKHIYFYLFIDSTNWFRIAHILLRIPQSCLFLEQFSATQCFSFLSVESKTAEKIKEKYQCCGFPNKSDFCLLRNPLTIHKKHSLAP